MTSWVRDPKDQRLVRSELDLDLEHKPEPELELGSMTQERTFSDIFYPPRLLCHHVLLCLTLHQM